MTDKKTLIYKEDLLNTVLNYFGCDLAYYGEDFQFCQEAIDLAPAVDAAEVVHGRWIGDGWGSYIKRCSVCRSVPLREVGGRHDACYSNYCPSCGAKMDGGNGA